MQRHKRPLVLARETIRTLATVELGRIAGGVIATRHENSCGCPGGSGYPTGVCGGSKDPPPPPSGGWPPTTQPQ